MQRSRAAAAAGGMACRGQPLAPRSRDPEWIDQHRVAEFRHAGSSLKFCTVAEGEADVYPRLSTTMEWDTAAGHAVLLAAGGRVTVSTDGR